MKRINLFGMAMGSTAMLVAGAAFADPPSGHAFNDWSADAGIITLQPDGLGGTNCEPPACVVLLNEVGMIQARVRADDDPNLAGYFQTITVDEAFTGPALAAEFRNESFVESADGDFSLASLNFVDLSGDGIMQVEIANGGLRDAVNNEAALDIYQVNTLGGFGNVDFWFARQQLGGPQFSTNSAAGGSLRIDYTPNNIAGDRGTPMTVRQTSGFYTAGSGALELVDGTSIGYVAGDHIGSAFITGLLWHGGPMHMPSNEHRIFEMQRIDNFTTAQSANWTNGGDANNMDDTGVGFVNFMAVWADEFAGNPNLWNDNFGPAPSAVPSGTATLTGLQADAFPDFPDHTP